MLKFVTVSIERIHFFPIIEAYKGNLWIYPMTVCVDLINI